MTSSDNIEHRGSSVGGQLTVSIGGASHIPERNEPCSSLIQAADQALYRAKRLGKNRVEFLKDGAWSPTNALPSQHDLGPRPSKRP